MKDRRTLFIIVTGGLIVFLAMGIRQSLGIFMPAITADLGIGREAYSLAIALQNILLGVPLAAMLADRYGSRWIAFGGGLLYAAALVLMAYLATTASLFVSLGLMAGIALSATSYAVILGAVAQVTPIHRRSTTFGLVAACGSLGMFAMIPVAQWLLLNYGWRWSFVVFGAMVGLIALLALGFPSRARSANRAATRLLSTGELTLAEMLVKARHNRSYWLLNAGFFVCGFHVAFIATHLPAYLADNGIGPGPRSMALAMIGLFNIAGSFLFGRLGDIYRKKTLLSILYFSRAVVIALFLLLPLTNVTAILFGAIIGFLWLATVPLTSGAVASIFGARYLATLYGIVMFSHQIGAFLGVWLGGRVFDATGGYTPVWLMAIGLGLAAALLHTPIDERPIRIERSEPALQET